MTINRREFLQRATAAGLSLSGASALLAACGGAATTTGGTTVTTVNLYHTIPTATETYWKQQLLPAFKQQYPNANLVTINLGVESPSAIRTKIKAGGAAAPDMAWLESGETGAYVDANLLPDVDGWLTSHASIKQDIYPSLIKLSSYKGKVWSLPWMTNNTAMQINLDAFAKAGVPIPSQDPTKTWTWDQFAEACKAITQKSGMKGFLINNKQPGWDAWLFHAWLATNNGTFLSDAGDPMFNGPEGLQTMTFLQGLVKDGYTVFNDTGYDNSAWFAGKAAITINGPWNFPDLAKFDKFKFTVVPFPVNKQPATNTGGDQLFIFNNSPQKVEFSLDYGGYILSTDFQVKFNIQSGNLPVTKSATESTEYQAHLKQYPFLAGWVNAVPYGVARSSLPQSGDAQTAFGQKAWDPIIVEQANVQQSLTSAASAVTALKTS